MVRKTVGHVELEWTCGHCQSRNPGSAKFCMSCGSPQPEDVEFHQPLVEELITDEEKLARAKAGPDIHCPYCGVRNPGTASYCHNCGGDLLEGVKRQAGRVVGAHRDEPAAPVICPTCGVENPATNRKCSNCGATLSIIEPEVAKPKPKARPAPAKKRSPMSLILIGGFLLVACIALAFIIFGSLKTEDLEGQVQSVSWARSIGIEALLPVTHSAFIDEIPTEAEIGSCEARYHHTQDEYVDGSVEVCGTPYTVDTGTGYGEVVQDCYYEVYLEYCEFRVNEWQEFDRAVLEGTDLNPRWPSVSIQPGEREGESIEQYQVTFMSSEGVFTYQTDDEDEYMHFAPGSTWLLKVNSFGSLVSVEPAD